MADTKARKVVELARSLLSNRRDAYAHLSRARAESELRTATGEFWGQLERVAGFREDEGKLRALLVAGGVSDSQARRWSREIVYDEEDDEIELDAPLLCAHCGSAMSRFRKDMACGVCGQPQGSAPEADRAEERSLRLVRALIASKRLELVSAHAEASVTDATAVVLNDHLNDAPAVVADALLEAWMDLDDVAEVFADVDEIVAALE